MNTRLTMLFGLAILLLCRVGGAAQPEPISVLVLSGTPQTVAHGFYDSVPLAAMISETYGNPLALGDPQITGKLIRYHAQADWEQGLTALNQYDVVVIWDAPRMLIRDGEPYDVLPAAWQSALARFVRKGGGLVINGGPTCYGSGNFLGGASAKTAEVADKLIYVGWQGSILEELLPVAIPASHSLESPQVGHLSFRKNTPGRECGVSGYGEATHPLVAGLNWQARPATAAHDVQPKPGAETMLSAQFGKKKEERPLIAGWRIGQGRVLAITFSPTAQAHQDGQYNREIFWQDDPVLWSRAVKWAAGRDKLMGNVGIEAAVRQRYAQRTLTFDGEKALPDWLREEYPYSVRILEVDSNVAARPAVFKWFRDLGFSYLSTHTWHKNDSQAFVADAARKADVLLVQSINPVEAKDEVVRGKLKGVVDPKHFFQLLDNGMVSNSYYSGPAPCPRNAKYRELAKEYCHKHAEQFGAEPRLFAYMLDDEFGWDMGYHPEHGIACYCPACNDYYRKQTGNAPPMPTFREPGYVAPKGDPWMQWVRTVRMNAYDPYHAELGKLLKTKTPWVKITGYPGGYFGGLDLINEEHYLDYWSVSELTACHHSDYRFATVNDMRGERHEQWSMYGLLRQFEQDIRSGTSQASFRLTSGCMLGSGVDGIHLWASPWLTKSPGTFGEEALWVEAKRLAGILRVYGPMFRALTRQDAPVWMMGGWLHASPHDAYLLIPLPTAERRKADPEWQWSQYFAEDLTYPALMRAGVQIHAITSRQLESEELFTKKAVVLPRLLYAEQHWLDRLQEFMKRGGKVYVDESCKVPIPGAIKLPVDLDAYRKDVVAGKRSYKNYETYVASVKNREALTEAIIPTLKEQITDVIPQPVTTNSDKCVYTIMEQGDARYLFVYNQDLQAPHAFTVRVNEPAAAIYDLGVERSGAVDSARRLKGQSIDTGLLPAGGWKIYLLAPQPVKRLQANAAVQGDALATDVRVLDSRGQTVRAAIPIRITLQRTDGDPLVFHRTTVDGEARFTIPLQQYAAAMTTVEITELVGGNTVRTRR
jgi:uncharacterized membrane protein